MINILTWLLTLLVAVISGTLLCFPSTSKIMVSKINELHTYKYSNITIIILAIVFTVTSLFILLKLIRELTIRIRLSKIKLQNTEIEFNNENDDKEPGKLTGYKKF